MRFLPTRIHGFLDYLVGAFLVVAPWVLGFADGTAAQWTPVVFGLAALAYSPVTRYEWGVVPVVPMRVHLWLDGTSGLLLAASPWLFGFSDRVFLPHLLLGLFEIVASSVTSTRPGRLGPAVVRS